MAQHDRGDLVKETRVALIAVGTLAMGVGAFVLSNDISSSQYPAIATWLIAALIIHDVLIAGVVFAVALAGRRAATRVPFVPIVIVQSALAIAAIVALIVIPEIVKDAVGTANPSILPLNYAANLAFFMIALAIVTAIAIALHLMLARRASAARVSD
ncbi:hypothetical protein ACWPKO_26590 (plasmid) [Coraliomargarita sp. W4R53]